MNTANFNPDVVVAAIIGFIIGALLVGIISYSSRKKAKPEEDPTLKELQALQKKYAAYRAKVNEHFAKTADSIDGLTKSYQQVFDHLSHGAQDLMDKQALQAQLEKRQNKAVTLAYLVEQEDAKPASAKPAEHKASASAKPTSASSTATSSTKPTPAAKPAPTATKPAQTGAKPAPAAAKPAPTGKPGETPVKQAPAQSGTGPAPTAAKPAPAATKPAPVSKPNETTAKPAPAANKPASASAAGSVKKPASATPAGKSEQPKSNVHIAAEKAGLKPIAKAADKQEPKIIQDKEHETVIESVKKHIKQETDEGNIK